MRARFVKHENPLDTLDIGRVMERQIEKAARDIMDEFNLKSTLTRPEPSPVDNSIMYAFLGYMNNTGGQAPVLYYLGFFNEELVNRFIGGYEFQKFHTKTLYSYRTLDEAVKFIKGFVS